jgi:hypothetical protein
MSERGWREFLAAGGVDDWVVLHGGATAVYRVRSLSEAAGVAGAIAQVPGMAGAGVLLTLADDRVSWLAPRRRSRAHMAAVLIVLPSRKCNWPSRPNATTLTWASGARSSAMSRWQTTTRSILSGMDQRCGCRNSTTVSRCVTRCTWTCPLPVSRSRPGSTQPSLPAVASSTIPTPHRTGRCPTGQVTAFVSLRGQMAPTWTDRQMSLR